MTANSEFQANLRAGRFSEAISQVVGRLVELDIVTVLPTTPGAAGHQALSTKVDLLSGQITNEISPEFLQNESYAKFLDFHTAQIGATSQMVREQLHALQALRENGHQLSPLPPLPQPEPKLETATIATPTGTDTMPVQAPPIELRPAEPPAIVSHLPAETTKVPPEVASIENLGLTESSDKPAPETPPTEVPMVAKVERLSPPAATELEPLSAVLPPHPAVSVATASAMSAAIAQAGSPDLSEASAIPNKLDQAMRSAGVKPEVEDQQHPFDLETVPPQANPVVAGSSSTIATPLDAVHPPANLDRELIDLLNDPNEQWDEWLLEEDMILSELSQVSQDAAKAKIPDLEADWFAQPVAKGEDSGMDDWERFIPEYTEPNSPANKGQANVERFRQNLVNDPQLMNELLAELDDIEQLGESKTPGSSPRP